MYTSVIISFFLVVYHCNGRGHVHRALAALAPAAAAGSLTRRLAWNCDVTDCQMTGDSRAVTSLSCSCVISGEHELNDPLSWHVQSKLNYVCASAWSSCCHHILNYETSDVSCFTVRGVREHCMSHYIKLHQQRHVFLSGKLNVSKLNLFKA